MNPAGLIPRVWRRLRQGGVRWAVGATWSRIRPPRAAMCKDALDAIRNTRGLEIGGPSLVFRRRGILPVYSVAARVDNVNFAPSTAWESELRDGGTVHFDRNRDAGTQWIREASDLHGVASEPYDFVLSSHCLEHLANPLAALREWKRVTKPDGHLVLVLPDPTKSFDHKRPITSMAHLKQDDLANVGENDLTHVAEVLALHDLSRDPDAGTVAEFRDRVAHNVENRCMHHHVFDLELVRTMLDETGWRVRAQEHVAPVHLLTWAQRD